MNKIAASIMCADQLNLTDELRKLEQAKVDLLHCDVMDGVYVNNLAMGPYVLEAIKESTTIPLDIHLATETPTKYIEMFAPIKPAYMSFHIEATDDAAKDIERLQKHDIAPVLAINTETPTKYIEMFAPIKPAYMSFHIEATDDAAKDIERLQKHDIAPVLAINPETPIETIYPYLGEIDMVLMMTVNPGFAGQQFNYTVLDKITALMNEMNKQAHHPLIEVDGNINEQTIPDIVERGADVYVLGTSQLFNKKPGTYQDKIKRVTELFE